MDSAPNSVDTETELVVSVYCQTSVPYVLNHAPSFLPIVVLALVFNVCLRIQTTLAVLTALLIVHERHWLHVC